MNIIRDFNAFNVKYTEYKGSRVDSIIRQNAIYKTQKLELKPFEVSNPAMAELLENSDFNTLRKKLSKTLILEGRAALVVVPHSNQYYITMLTNISYSSVGKNEIEVQGTTDSTYVHDGVNYPVLVRVFYNEQGRPTISRYIVLTNKHGVLYEESITDEFVYPTTVLPVEVFVNNEDELSDVEYFAVQESLRRLDYFDGQLRGEFELSKTVPYYNTNFTDADPKAETAALKGGKGYMQETSYDAKVREGQSLIPSTAAYLNVKALCDSIELDIREKMGMTELPGMEKGTNKHTAEIIYKQEYTIDYLLNMRQAREDHYNQFFKKVSKLIGGEQVVIELQLNDITQSKLDLLKAAIAAENAKTTQVGMQKATETTGEETNE